MADDDLSKLKIDKSRARGTAGRRPRKWKWAFWIVLVAVVAVAAAYLYGTGSLTPAVDVKSTTVALAYPSQASTVLNASGYVVPQRKAAIASKVTGTIVSLVAVEGARVKKGDVIARLENQDALATQRHMKANLEYARCNLDQAKAELNDAGAALARAQNLWERKLIARADYDTAETRHKKAQAAVAGTEASIRAATAALEGADVSLEYTLLRVPFDAVILTKNADVGDIITPLGAAANAKAAVVTIADMGSLQVEADVSESSLAKVRIGQPCEIQLDALPDKRFRGIVKTIVPTAERSKATVMVKTAFVDRDERILPEMSAKVAFLSKPLDASEQKPRLCVAASALLNRGAGKSAFRIVGGVAMETVVTAGAPLGDMVEIVNGLQPGDRVVLGPSEKVRHGSKIRVADQ